VGRALDNQDASEQKKFNTVSKIFFGSLLLHFLMLTFFSFQHTQKSWIRLAGIPVTSNSEAHTLKWLLFYFKACLPYTKSKWLSYPVIQGLSTRYSWPLYCIQNLNQGSKLNHKPRTLIQIGPKSCTYILVQIRTKNLSNRASLTSTFNGISSLTSLKTQDHKTIILIGHKPSSDKTENVNLHNPLNHIINICLSIKASVFKK
jgi:hypothetical protein